MISLVKIYFDQSRNECAFAHFYAMGHGCPLRVERGYYRSPAEGSKSGAESLKRHRTNTLHAFCGPFAGLIAEALEAQPSRISFHLNQLEQAGLVESRREGRSIIYSAIFPALSDLVAFLMRDCCEGHCAVCDKAIALFAKCTGRPTEQT